jgi:Concanavalin A-like lectin/glucanases superfamily
MPNINPATFTAALARKNKASTREADVLSSEGGLLTVLPVGSSAAIKNVAYSGMPPAVGSRVYLQVINGRRTVVASAATEETSGSDSRSVVIQQSMGGGGLSLHALADTAIHTGTLADAQAPQFYKLDGTRSLSSPLSFSGSGFLGRSGTGNLTLAASADATITFPITGISAMGAGSLTATSANSTSVADHTHAIDSTIARSAITISGTGALTGGGNLTANRTISLNTPGTLTVSGNNSASTNHTHQITSSSAPSVASLLASNATGGLQLTALGIGVAPVSPLHIRSSAAQIRLEPDAISSSSIATAIGGNMTISTSGDLVLAPAGQDVLPLNAYNLNIGALNQKFLTLHAAELWVETLVASNTISTIGGNILVSPTTILASDLLPNQGYVAVKHNSLISGDIGYLQANGKYEAIRIESGTFVGSDYRAAVVSSGGLVGYWRLDEASGTTFASQVNSLTGVGTGVTNNAAGIIAGNAGVDMPSTANIDVADNALFDCLMSNHTIVLAYRPTSFAALVGLISKTTTNIPHPVDIQVNTSGALAILYGNGSLLQSFTSGTLTLNQWHVIAITVSGTALSVYINGVLSTTHSLTQARADSNLGLRFGRRRDNGLNAGGRLDEIAIWSRALSASDISGLSALMLNNTPIGPANSFLYWVTRNMDGTGQNQWFAGDALANTGQPGSGGVIDLYSYWSFTNPPLTGILYATSGGTVFGPNQNYTDPWQCWPTAPVANDAMYFGAPNSNFSTISAHLITPGSTGTSSRIWEYWNGSSWASFTPTSGTDNLTLGPVGKVFVSWWALSGWVSSTVSGITAFWVRWRVVSGVGITPSSLRIASRERRRWGPTIAGYARASTTFNDLQTRWALGNLNGHYGYGTDVSGFAAGDFATSWISADATSGFRINHGTNVLAQMATTGALTIGRVAEGASRVVIEPNGNLRMVTRTGGVDVSYISLLGPNAPSGSNMVRNGSFEVDNNLDGNADMWAVYNNGGVGTNSSIVAGGPFGSKFQRIEFLQPTANTAGLIYNEPTQNGEFVWNPNSSYVVSWYAKAPSGSGLLGRTATLRWNISPASQVALLNPVLTTSWQRYAVRIDWGASVEASGRFFVDHNAQATVFSGAIDFDGFMVEQVAPGENVVSEYRDYFGVIPPGTIFANHISINSLSALSANLGLVTAGEILLGNAASFSGSYTGLRMFKSGATYQLVGYNAGVPQAWFDSDGTLKAGAGMVRFDASGLILSAETPTSPNAGSVLRFMDNANPLGVERMRIWAGDGVSQAPAVTRTGITVSGGSWFKITDGSSDYLSFYRVGIGLPVNFVAKTDLPFFGLRIYASDWFGTIGNGGWRSETHGGGWHMSDSTWMRSYANKAVFTSNVMRADSGFQTSRANGAGVFSLDVILGGYSETQIANNAVWGPFGSTNNFGGMIIVSDSLVNGSCGVFLVGNGVRLIGDSQGSSYSHTPGTAGRINVYWSGSRIVIQNTTGSTCSVSVASIRTRGNL